MGFPMGNGSRSGAEPKRPLNVSVSRSLVDEARALEINISQACERGLAREIAEARSRRWRDENRAAIEASNAYVEREGLPLARYRQF